MSMISMMNRPKADDRSSLRRTERRAEASALEQKLRLRHEKQVVDFTELDRTTHHVQHLLERNENLYHKLSVLRDLISSFRVVIERAEAKHVDTYTLRQKLMSLERRAISLYREMSRQTRAPEFDLKALKKLLKDYEAMRN